jgi:hypothetical protein
VFFLGDALCETAKAARVTEVWVDVDARVCVEREFCGFFDAPARGGDEKDGARGRECGGRVAEGGVEGQRSVGCVVEDADGDELGGCAISVDDYIARRALAVMVRTYEREGVSTLLFCSDAFDTDE